MLNCATNEETYTVPFLDNVTELYNSNAFFMLAQHQMRIALRSKRWLSLFLINIDIDGKKSPSKRRQIAIDMAAILKKTFRNSDIVARLGEYEFALLAIEAHYTSSHLILARLQKTLENFNSNKKKPYRLSFKMGTSFYDPDRPCSLPELLARANATML